MSVVGKTCNLTGENHKKFNVSKKNSNAKKVNISPINPESFKPRKTLCNAIGSCFDGCRPHTLCHKAKCMLCITLNKKLPKSDDSLLKNLVLPTEHDGRVCPLGYTKSGDRKNNGPINLENFADSIKKILSNGHLDEQKKKEAENRKINIWKNPKYDNYCVDAIILGEEIQKDVEETKPLTLVVETKSSTPSTLVEETKSSTPFVEDTKHSAVKLLLQLKITLTKNPKEQSSKSEIKEIDINTVNDSIVSETTNHTISEKNEYDEWKIKFEKLLQTFEITGLEITPEIKKLFDDSFKILSPEK